MKLIFIYGLPGVGKYTVGEEVARRTGMKLFHNHMVLDFIISIFGRNITPIVELREKMWLDVFKQAVKEDMKGMIFTFAFDKYLSPGFIEEVESIILPRGSIFYIALACSLDVLEKRVDSRPASNKINSFKKLKPQIDDQSFFVPKMNKSHLSLDVTHLSPQVAAQRIITYCS